MHAFLITSGTKKLRQEIIEKKLTQWNISKIDQVMVDTDGPSIGISDIRDLEQRLKLHPYQSPYSVAVISNAQKLTTEAQHALLKTLEEPPPHAKLILETSQSDSLIGTILSRCERVDLGVANEYTKDDERECFTTLLKLTSGSIGNRLKIIEGIAQNKEDALTWIDLALSSGRNALLENKISPKILRGLLTARIHIMANVNPKLALDNLFLSL